MKINLIFSLIFSMTTGIISNAQHVMTTTDLWKLKRIEPLGISKDKKYIVYKIKTPSVSGNNFSTKAYKVPIEGGEEREIIEGGESLVTNNKISPDGKHLLYSKQVKEEKLLGKDLYPALEKSNVYVFNSLDYRHWDTYNEGLYYHIFYKKYNGRGSEVDIMDKKPYYSSSPPTFGADDYIWSPDSRKIIFVSKKLRGTKAANSTNTDIYEYDIEKKTFQNKTSKNLGYDTAPVFSPSGHLTWLQMKRNGYEADKNDIIVDYSGKAINLTENWDGTVNNFFWDPKGDKVYFVAPVEGTEQLFEVNFPSLSKVPIKVRQITKGDFNIKKVIGIVGELLFLTREDMNHASEIFSYNSTNGKWKQISKVNADFYKKILPSKVEKRWISTTDGKKMLTWVIFPPDFDPNKKYPTLLYLQGGPQSALSQFYSYRWNFQLMAANGYIVVAPNRRGMPGYGVEWNEKISKDWGGQPMRDYLSAIDTLSKESYVDENRLGAVGASYGGYSVYFLAGIHNNRFKTFIAHAGVFNLESMYGTTDELFFNNWEAGGPYWEKGNTAAQKTYKKFNPIRNVERWNTPMLVIHGGRDYRVPIGQGQEAFQALQQKGIKSRFIYFPEENHWILKPQNAVIWQNEFFKWLSETL
ncbi:MAG: S9 family peptidase [Bergeyella sp.]|nr:S9 family peptidase [Bergeyella sp.]